MFGGARAKTAASLHSQIALACCKTGKDRRDEFDSIEQMMPNWKTTAHPNYVAMADAAISDLQKPWNDILSDLSATAAQASSGP